MNVAFVTNMCPHYRIRTFEMLARYHNVQYYFFSAGDEWYWQQQHGVKSGDFRHEYLPGFRLGKTRVTPTLPWKLWKARHDVFVKCINGRFALPITYLIARMQHKPFILWTGIWMRLQTRPHRLFFPLTRYIYRHADAIVVYGEHVKAYLLNEGVPAERIFVAAHAVDNDLYAQPVSEDEKVALRQQLDIGPEQRVILYLGRLEPMKGLSALLEAFALLQRTDSVLVLAGTGSEQPNLVALARRIGIADRVRFSGYVPANQTMPYYALAWALVLPSITTPTFKEPWGLVVNEAFNQGTPVVASDAVGAAAGGLVQHDVTGLIVPEQDIQALTQALQRLIDHPELRDRLSNNARELIAGWDNARMVDGFLQAIRSVVHPSKAAENNTEYSIPT